MNVTSLQEQKTRAPVESGLVEPATKVSKAIVMGFLVPFSLHIQTMHCKVCWDLILLTVHAKCNPCVKMGCM